MRNEEIGKRIQQQRKALNISVVDVAAYTGLSKATIHRNVQGKIKGPAAMTSPFINYSSLISGNPAMLVARDNTPASREADITIFQSTALNTDAVPITATKV